MAFTKQPTSTPKISRYTELPREFPAAPQEILDRFPTASEWRARVEQWWFETRTILQVDPTPGAVATTQEDLTVFKAETLASIGALQTTVAALEAEDDELAENLAATNTTVTNIAGDVETNTTTITTIQSSITTINNTTSNLQQQINNIGNAISAGTDYYFPYWYNGALTADGPLLYSAGGNLDFTPVGGSITLGKPSSGTTELRFLQSAAGTNYVGFKAPSTVTTPVVWALPPADGANSFVIQTDGAGNLSWIANGAGVSTGITTLNTLTAATQTFATDNNISVVSATSTHTLTWAGTLSVARGGNNIASYAVGDILYASGATTLTKLVVGSNGQVLTLAAGVPSWATPTTGTVTGTGAVNALAYWSSSTAIANLGLGTTAQVLHGNAGGLATWGAVVLTTDVSGTLPYGNGGTGSNAIFVNGGLVYATSTAVLSTGLALTYLAGVLSLAPSGNVINTGALTEIRWLDTTGGEYFGIKANASTTSQTYTWPDGPPGGTYALTSTTGGVMGWAPFSGALSGTTNGVAYFSSTTALTSTVAGTTAQFLRGAGAGSPPTWGTILASDLPSGFTGLASASVSVGLVAVTGSGTTAMYSNSAPALDQSISPTWSALHTFSKTTQTPVTPMIAIVDLWASVASLNRSVFTVYNTAGAQITFTVTSGGSISVGQWAATAIQAVYGGTGQTVYAVGDLLYADTTTSLTKLVAGANGYVLTLAAGVPTWAAGAAGTVTGTGTVNRLTYWTSGSAIGAISSLGTTSTVLHGNAGGTPTWGQITLTTAAAEVTGILPVVNGGTNLATLGGANRVLFSSSATQVATSATLTWVEANGALTLNAWASGTSGVMWRDLDGSNYVFLQAPTDITQSQEYKWPVEYPLGTYALVSNTGGEMSWSPIGSGTVTGTGTANALAFWATPTSIDDLALGATGTVLIGNTGTTPSFSASPSITSLTVSGTVTLSGLTASRLLMLDGSKNVVSLTAAETNLYVLTTNGSGTYTWTAAGGGPGTGTDGYFPQWSSNTLTGTSPIYTASGKLNILATSGLVQLLPPSGTATAALRFFEGSDNGTNFTALRAAASLSGDLTYVLPSTNPTAGQILSSTAPSGGVATLSWIAAGSGVVTSITGVTNKIDVNLSNPAIPELTISTNYTGQVSISTLGTIATGQWRGTIVEVGWGGTGFGTYTVGDILYANSTTTLARLAYGAAGRVLASNGDGTYTWTSPTGGSFSGTAGRFPFTGADTLLNATDSPILYSLASGVIGFFPDNNAIEIREGGAATRTTMEFFENSGSGTNWTGIRGPAATGSNFTMSLPAGAPGADNTPVLIDMDGTLHY